MKSIAAIFLVAVCVCIQVSSESIGRYKNGDTLVYELDELNYAIASPKLAQMDTLTLSVVGGNTYHIIKENCHTYVKTVHDFGHEFNEMIKKARKDAHNSVTLEDGAKYYSSSVSSSHSSSSSSTYINGEVSERSESSHRGESTYLKGNKDHVTYTGSKLPSHLKSITVDKKHVVFLDVHGVVLMKPNKCLDDQEIAMLKRAGFQIHEVDAEEHHEPTLSNRDSIDEEVQQLHRRVREMHDELGFN